MRVLGSSTQRASTATLSQRTVFDRFARWAEHQLGRSIAFALAVLSIVVWGVTGPLFGWSDTWQLVINTGTTIVTFLMVFVIQNAQNRDTQALQLKLVERAALDDARDYVIEIPVLGLESGEFGLEGFDVEIHRWGARFGA